MRYLPIAVASAALVATGAVTDARAECAFQNDVPVKSLSAGFEAWKAVTDAMAECGNVEAELDQEFRTKQPQAFAANPSLYHLGGVSNSTITPLINQGTIRPLDDLVEQYGQDLKDNQIIRIGGDIMAIAFMVNTQQLTYRQDILEEQGIEVPTTWEGVLEAAEKLKDVEGIEYPLGATTKTGFDIAVDFINMYAGSGEPFINDDSTLAIMDETGVTTLETMKRMTEYLDPEYLVSDSTYVQQQMQQGKIAMTNLWASRGGAMDDEQESQVVGDVATSQAPVPPTGDKPGATIWWDGFVVAKNISDEEAEAAFRVALEGMDTEMVEANNDAAVWLIDGYEPTRLTEGAIATLTHEPPAFSYPSSAEMGLLQSALGTELAAYFTGDRTAQETLDAVNRAYETAARDAGVLN